jgi:hypothetical protein
MKFTEALGKVLTDEELGVVRGVHRRATAKNSIIGIIGALRVANMPKTLWEVCQESWRKSLSIEDYTWKYAEWVNPLWQRGTMDFGNTATPSGVYGERY